MKNVLLATLFFIQGIVIAQITTNPKSKIKNKNTENENRRGLYVGLGSCVSSLNLYRNYRQNPYQISFNGRLYWEFADNLRLMASYSYTPKFDVKPTWLNVHNSIVDLNFNIFAHIQDQKALLYTITGCYYQSWKGFYTGIDDFNSTTNTTLLAGKTHKSNFVGINTGLGLERSFKYFQLFGEFQFRFSKTEMVFNIADAVYTAGIKTRVPLNKLLRGLNGKYPWIKRMMD